MKKLILLFGASLFFTLTYAQNLKFLKIDTTGVISGYGIKPFTLGKELLNNPEFFALKNTPDFLPDPQTLGNIYRSMPDEMPVIRPSGNYPMRIYRPDPSISYSLIIKRIPMIGHKGLKR